MDFLSITQSFETIKRKKIINSMYKYSGGIAWHENYQVKI